MNYQESQHAEQKRWQLLPQWKNLNIFDELLVSEFLASDIQKARTDKLLARILRYCKQEVPFYQSQIAERKIDINAILSVDDLHKLPVLDRAAIQANCDALHANQLPPSMEIGGVAKTSGSTGQPVEVTHTANSLQYCSILKQREYRAWGFDPSKRLGVIRPAADLGRHNGNKLQNKHTWKYANWPLVGDFFITGDSLALPDTSGTDFMTEWLNEHKPNYLLSMSAVLEQIALGYTDRENIAQISAALSISQQLTQGMRELVVKKVTPNVQQNYGLNEIGLVAMRCPESGYYHVHNESCLIEIVDSNGSPCEPGVAGKLLVTSLLNFAMPLLRYDTDDLAEFPIIPCPCGRGSQSFTNIRGRYRRTAHLPEGTWDYWDAILAVFGGSSPEEMSVIKQYQLHQLSAEKFDLKLKVEAPVSEALKKRIHEKCKLVGKGKLLNLTILEVARIEQPGKKFQNFISDIVPKDD